MRIEFVIVLALAVGATFFVIVIALGLLINKLVEVRQTRKRERLYEFYSGLFADLLLQPVSESPDPSRKSALFDEYEAIIEPVKNGLSWSAPTRKRLHRSAIRQVLTDFASDLVGESMDRLVYFFYSFEFVQEELALLHSKKWWVRAQAARDLGVLRARKATTALAVALEDEHPDVRNEAMQSLVKLAGVEALRTILKVSRNISKWTSLALSVIVKESEEESFPYLIEALEYSDQSIVLFAIDMLAEIGFVAAVEPLMRTATSYPNIVVRARATEALGRLGDQRAEKILHEFLENPYPQLRASATRALERIGSPSSVPLLRERMETGSIRERISAAKAMARSGERGLEELRGVVNHPDETLRAIAHHVLEEIDGVQVPGE